MQYSIRIVRALFVSALALAACQPKTTDSDGTPPVSDGGTNPVPDGGTLADIIDTTQSTLTATPDDVVANGLESTTVTVTLKDSLGAAVTGQAVVFSASGGGNHWLPQSGKTGPDGTLTAKLRSTQAGLKTIVAAVASAKLQTSVRFSAPRCPSFSLVRKEGGAVSHDGGFHPMAVGDFNEDGKLDLASVSNEAETVSVLLGNGDGTFQTASDFPVGKYPMSLPISDVNGDGHLDIVVGNGNSRFVSLLLGAGNGHFSVQKVDLDGLPWSVTLGDFDADGLLDLGVLKGATGGAVASILPGNGNGTFRTAIDSAIVVTGSQALSADLNADGVLDFVEVMGISAQRGVNVFLGSGGGQFSLPDFTPLTWMDMAEVADINGDGLNDLAIGSYNAVGAMLGKGDGTFGEPIGATAGPGVESIALGDFDGDGKLDLAVQAVLVDQMEIMLGSGDGKFHEGAKLPTSSAPSRVAVGDFDGDGRLDVVVSNNATKTIDTFLNRCDP